MHEITIDVMFRNIILDIIEKINIIENKLESISEVNFIKIILILIFL